MCLELNILRSFADLSIISPSHIGEGPFLEPQCPHLSSQICWRGVMNSTKIYGSNVYTSKSQRVDLPQHFMDPDCSWFVLISFNFCFYFLHIFTIPSATGGRNPLKIHKTSRPPRHPSSKWEIYIQWTHSPATSSYIKQNFSQLSSAPSTVEKYRGKYSWEIQWGNTVEKYSGKIHWGNTVGKYSGETQLRNTIVKIQ